jgi:hypothetical protein
MVMDDGLHRERPRCDHMPALRPRLSAGPTDAPIEARAGSTDNALRGHDHRLDHDARLEVTRRPWPWSDPVKAGDPRTGNVRYETTYDNTRVSLMQGPDVLHAEILRKARPDIHVGVPRGAAVVLAAKQASDELQIVWTVAKGIASAVIDGEQVAAVYLTGKRGDPYAIQMDRQPASAKLQLAILHGMTVLGGKPRGSKPTPLTI